MSKLKDQIQLNYAQSNRQDLDSWVVNLWIKNSWSWNKY